MYSIDKTTGNESLRQVKKRVLVTKKANVANRDDGERFVPRDKKGDANDNN